MRWLRILSWTKMSFEGFIPKQIATAKAIANNPQSTPPTWFCTGHFRKCNCDPCGFIIAQICFLVSTSKSVNKLSNQLTCPSLQSIVETVSQCPESIVPLCRIWIMFLSSVLKCFKFCLNKVDWKPFILENCCLSMDCEASMILSLSWLLPSISDLSALLKVKCVVLTQGNSSLSLVELLLSESEWSFVLAFLFTSSSVSVPEQCFLFFPLDLFLFEKLQNGFFEPLGLPLRDFILSIFTSFIISNKLMVSLFSCDETLVLRQSLLPSFSVLSDWAS